MIGREEVSCQRSDWPSDFFFASEFFRLRGKIVSTFSLADVPPAKTLVWANWVLS